jgi:predicted XRE-type DNA-binding protein
MNKKQSTFPSSYISKGNVLDDLDLSPEQIAVVELKLKLHREILNVIKAEKYTPRELEKVLNIAQPRVSELLNAKISMMSADKLTQYLFLLGRKLVVKTKKRRLQGQKAA